MSAPTVVVTGIGGGLARNVARRLLARGARVVGVDYRDAPPVEGVTLHRAHYAKTAIEDVFRRAAPVDAVLHLGRVGNLAERVDLRFDLNVVGTRKIMQLARAHGARALVVLSTFHIYGADPRNHVPISEEDPLRAGVEFPEIADAIQLDSMASTWVHQFPELRVVVLRPTNVVGPTIRNTMSQLLRRARVPHLAGFDPMSQFVHEDDLAGAILASLDGGERGVFNVAGAEAVPWRTALHLAGARTFPVPSGLLKLYMRAFSSVPPYLVNFFKHPCVITDRAFRGAFGWSPTVDVRETLASTVRGQRGGQPVDGDAAASH